MKVFCSVLLAAAIWAVPAMAQASSLYLTFEGTVSSIKHTGSTGSQVSVGASVGDTLSYTLLVDTDRPGEYVRNGRTYTMDTPNSYFVTLVSGGALSGDTSKLGQYNYGYSFSSGSTDYSIMVASNDYTAFALQSYGLSGTPDQWEQGASASNMFEVTYGEGADQALVNFSGATLTRVSASAPTPVPAAVWIMGSGLGLLGMVRRRFSKK